MFSRCGSAIKSGRVVILDASFSKIKYRKKIDFMAKKLGTGVLYIETYAPDRLIRERLLQREKTGRSVSDARLDIYAKFKEGYDEPNEIPSKKHLRINTNKEPAEILGITLKRIINLRYKN